MAAKAVKIVYIFKTNIIFFSGTNILLFQKVYTFHEKGIYFSGKNIILFRQKVYTFLVKSIYFFKKEIMLLYISDIQLIILSPTIRENTL